MKSTLIQVNEQLGPKHKPDERAYILLHKSTEIQIVLAKEKKRKVFSCLFVRSTQEDKHHATEAFQEAEEWARHLKCHEIWYVTPLNKKLLFILLPLGWTLEDKLAYHPFYKEWVNGFRKILT